MSRSSSCLLIHKRSTDALALHSRLKSLQVKEGGGCAANEDSPAQRSIFLHTAKLEETRQNSRCLAQLILTDSLSGNAGQGGGGSSPHLISVGRFLQQQGLVSTDRVTVRYNARPVQQDLCGPHESGLGVTLSAVRCVDFCPSLSRPDLTVNDDAETTLVSCRCGFCCKDRSQYGRWTWKPFVMR